jgi:uncharacterized protein
MSPEGNVDVVKSLYVAWAQGDEVQARGILSEGIEWWPAEGHPYSPNGEPWRGLKQLTEAFFARVGREWSNFETRPERIYAAEPNIVVVEGRYVGIFRPTGRAYDAQFCHIWTLNMSRQITCLRQYADTAQMQRVMIA